MQRRSLTPGSQDEHSAPVKPRIVREEQAGRLLFASAFFALLLVSNTVADMTGFQQLVET